MFRLHPINTSLKLYACFALLTCLSVAGACSILAQLTPSNLLSVATGQNFNPSGGNSNISASISNVRIGLWLYIVLMPALAGALAYWLRSEVQRPVREAVAAARRVAAGDLRTAVGAGAGDELLDSMRDMKDKLAGMIVKVRGGTDSIASGAGDIARGSRDLSARAADQAAALAATAASMEQLTTTAHQHADAAHQASTLGCSASEMALRGGALVADMVGTMAAINDSSRRIADIIGVIDDIAFQTNILALNAAVEAARAGEQGRGFAAVATEVRTLAQRCAVAAREIKLLIEDSVAKTNAGGTLADQAGQTMQDLVLSVGRVSELIGTIADASAGQRIGIEQVSQAIAAMDQSNHHNAALAAQSATAAAAMRDQAGALARAIGAFVLAPEHGGVPLIHLAHNNPNPLLRLAPEGRGRARIPAVRAVAPLLKPVRNGGTATRRHVDCEEF